MPTQTDKQVPIDIGVLNRPPRVLLIRPPLWKTICASTPPLGLGYLLTSLRHAGLPAALLDLSVRKDPDRSLAQALQGSSRPDIVGIQVFSNELASARYVVERVRELGGDSIVIVAGGPHVTTMPHLVFTHIPQLDLALRGEAETSLVELVRRLSEHDKESILSTPGLVWRDGEQVRMNRQVFEQDLDRIAPPDWEAMELHRYHADAFGGGFTRRSPAMCMQTTRGCPFDCTFCAVLPIAGRRLRCHSAAQVVAQVKELVERGYREIKIVDDNFAADPRHVRRVREAFEKERVNVAVSFACGLHLRTINEELIGHIKAMGVYEVMVAIESGSDRVLADMKKNITVALVKDKIALLRRHGFPVTGYFMLGYPTEQQEDLQRTIRLALTLPLERAHFNCFSPYPGSEVYDQLEKEDRLPPLNLEAVHAETVNYSFVPGVSVRQLDRLRRRAFLRFYLRPRILWPFLRGMRSWPVVKFRAQKALEYFGWTTRKKVALRLGERRR